MLITRWSSAPRRASCRSSSWTARRSRTVPLSCGNWARNSART